MKMHMKEKCVDCAHQLLTALSHAVKQASMHSTTLMFSHKKAPSIVFLAKFGLHKMRKFVFGCALVKLSGLYL